MQGVELGLYIIVGCTVNFLSFVAGIRKGNPCWLSLCVMSYQILGDHLMSMSQSLSHNLLLLKMLQQLIHFICICSHDCILHHCTVANLQPRYQETAVGRKHHVFTWFGLGSCNT